MLISTSDENKSKTSEQEELLLASQKNESLVQHTSRNWNLVQDEHKVTISGQGQA